MTEINRAYYNRTDLEDPKRDRYGEIITGTMSEVATLEASNLVSSRIKGTPDLHLPAIDLDFPCTLVPSRTEGHFHLYLDRPLTWDRYKVILDAFLEAGLIDVGWHRQALKDKQTYLRTGPYVQSYLQEKLATAPEHAEEI